MAAPLDQLYSFASRQGAGINSGVMSFAAEPPFSLAAV
jgi:hypothetical protein